MGRTGAALALAALAIAGCSDTRSNDAAAVVDGTEVSRQDYEDLLQAVAANPELFGIEEDLETGTIAGDAGRSLLQVLVVDAAGERYLVANGESVTDADRQAVLDSIGTSAQNVPPDILDLDVGLRARSAAFGRLAAAAGEAQAAWEATPGELGLLCVRHILVETEEEAQDVLAELEDGADFAELAAERSTDPGAQTTGGALEATPGQPCVSIQQAQGGLDPTFLQAAVQAVPGTPVGPVETSFGWHVILARPYEEVADAVNAAFGEQAFRDHLSEVDVEIDPRYGRWDSATRSIVALDAPDPSIPAP